LPVILVVMLMTQLVFIFKRRNIQNNSTREREMSSGATRCVERELTTAAEKVKVSSCLHCFACG